VTYLRLLVLAGLAAIGLVVPGAVSAGAGKNLQNELTATVGSPTFAESFAINLSDSAGNKVSHLDPGTYTITVHDYATTHNFALSGPGVTQATDIDRAETVTWVVQFTDGKYNYICQAHPTQMRGSFTVGTVTTTPPPKKLNARVGPGRTISLKTASGARVKSVTAGRYRISVRDASRVDNFHLIGPGINKKTGIKARTTTTWSATFRSGPVRYRSDATKKLRGSFAVRAGG
jgi:plastocyanin